MYSKTTVVKNRTGLHARPASEFVACAAKFSSKVTIKKLGAEKEVNAKSIILLLSLALVQGTEVEISAAGEDETAAVEALVALIDGGFGE